MRKHILLTIALLLSLILTSFVSAKDTYIGPYSYVDQYFSDYRGKQLLFATREGTNNDWYIVKNNRRLGQKFSSIEFLTVSPDKQSYSFRGKIEDKVFLFKDNQNFGEGVVFSKYIGKEHSLIYIVKKGSQFYLMKDGKSISGGYSYIDQVNFIESDSKENFAFAAKRGSEWYVLQNGKEVSQGSKEVSKIRYIPGTERLTYITRFAAKNQYDYDKDYLIIDTEAFPTTYTAITDYIYNGAGNITLIVPDGMGNSLVKNNKKLATPLEGKSGVTDVAYMYGDIPYYTYKKDEKKYAYMRGKYIGPFTQLYTPYSSENLKKIFTILVNDNKYFSVIDGKIGGEEFSYIDPSSVHFSQDERNVSYIAQVGGKYKVFKNYTAQGKEYNFIGRNTFSPDGSHLAYIGNDQQKFYLIVDGKEVVGPLDKIVDFSYVDGGISYVYTSQGSLYKSIVSLVPVKTSSVTPKHVKRSYLEEQIYKRVTKLSDKQLKIVITRVKIVKKKYENSTNSEIKRILTAVENALQKRISEYQN